MKRPLIFTQSQLLGLKLFAGILTVFLLASFLWKGMEDGPSVTTVNPEEVFDLPDLPEASQLILDINLADSADFVQLRGIGPVLARRIVSYRKSIGGFQSVSDLSRVYNLPQDALAALSDQLYVDSLTHSDIKSNRTLSPNLGFQGPKIDINTASAEELAQLPGIGTVLGQRIVNYREHKGGYQSIDEVSKVYHLSQEVFDEIRQHLVMSPYPESVPVLISSLEPMDQETSRGPAQEADPIPEVVALGPASVDINLADSAQLDAVPGIGPVLSRRIIRYRKLLRYYSNVDQLLHVYGLSEENFALMRPYLTVSEVADFPKNNLNEAFTKALSFYPFVSRDLAESLVRYRRDLGRFDSWEEVMEVPGMTPEILEEIKAYYHL